MTTDFRFFVLMAGVNFYVWVELVLKALLGAGGLL